MKIISKALRDAARGQECTLQIVDVCNGRTDTTVLAHFPDETNGMGTKSCDLSAGFACHECHNQIDRRTKSDMTQAEREWYMRRAQIRTWRYFVEAGLIKIKGHP